MLNSTRMNKGLVHFLEISIIVVLAGAIAYYFYNSNATYSTDHKPDNLGFYMEQFPNAHVDLTREEAQMRAQLISNCSYTIALNLLQGSYYEGYVEIEYHLKNMTEDQELFLDYEGDYIKWISINNDPILVNDVYSKKRIQIPNNYQKMGATNRIEIYLKNSYANDGLGLHHFTDPEDGNEYLYTQCEAFFCNKIFPLFDQPDIKASFELKTLTVPEWEVIGNEILMETKHSPVDKENLKNIQKILKENNVPIEFLDQYVRKSGKQVSLRIFKKSPIISTYLFAVIAGPYSYIESTDGNKKNGYPPMRFYCRKSLLPYTKAYAEEFFLITKRGMDFYLEFFGYPSFHFSKYDQIFVPEFNHGAMENVGAITFTESYVWKEKPTELQRNGMAITILHELSHMWFGDLVTMQWWNDLWLNEAFATLLSHIALDKSLGLEQYTKSWEIFLRYKEWGKREDQRSTTHSISGLVANTEEAQNTLDGITYGKGSAVLKQLIYLVGHNVFKQGIQMYFQTYQWGNTKLLDLILKLQASIDQNGVQIDLLEWANIWLNTSGLNQIEPIYTIQNGLITSFKLKQTKCEYGTNTLRMQKLDIAIYNENMEEEIIYGVVLEPKYSTDVPQMLGKPASAAILVNKNDQAYAKVKLDNDSRTFIIKNIGRIKDPITSLQIWGILWNMVRDLELSAAEFNEMAIKQIEHEQNSGVLTFMINNAGTGYIPLEYKAEFLHQTFTQIYHRLEKEPDQNIRKILIKMIANFAYQRADTDILIEWVRSGPKDSNGRAIDVEFGPNTRYSFIKAIYLNQEIKLEVKQELLEKELEKDKSYEGILAEQFCKARVHSSENKRELWEWYMNSTSTHSDKLKKESMLGFWHWSQMDILTQYVDRYFVDVLEVFETRDRQYAKIFCMSLDPPLFTRQILKKHEDLLTKIPENEKTFYKIISDNIIEYKRGIRALELSNNYLLMKNK